MKLKHSNSIQKQIIKFIKILMNQKKSNIKPGGDANVDENSE
jgi:hypothetical protein